MAAGLKIIHTELEGSTGTIVISSPDGGAVAFVDPLKYPSKDAEHAALAATLRMAVSDE